MKKLFCVLSWLSGLFGVGMMLIGCIKFILGTEFLGIKNWENVYYPAYNFLLLAILLLLASRGDCKKQD
jgi:hypothetical protein